MRKEVPTETLRRAVEDSGLALSEIARRMGWFRADDSRVKRAIGLQAAYRHNGQSRRIQSTNYNKAVDLVRACGLDPVDYDL